jgi:hypothetical protein
VFVVGWTVSTSGFPLANPPGGVAYYDGTLDGNSDAFIAKFSGSNLSLLWSTCFGGNDMDEAFSVAVDTSGNVFVVGATGSTSGFPLEDPGGGAYYQNTNNGGFDAFIAKFLGSDLRLVWSTYFGGTDSEAAFSVAVDTSGNVFVVGATTSTSDFPLENPGGVAYYDSTLDGSSDVFIAKFSRSNLRLVWSTYFGGNYDDIATSVAVDGSGNVFVVGWTTSRSDFPLENPGGVAYFDNTRNGIIEAFIVKFSGSDLRLVWSTYFGGNLWDEARSVAVDGSGNVFVLGQTDSFSGFPLVNTGGGAYFDNTLDGTRDAFIAKFSGSNLSLVWSTYYGGSNSDYPWDYRGIAAGAGFIVVGVVTSSSNLPVGNHPSPCSGGFYQGTHGGA